MVDVNKFRGKMRERNLTQDDISKALNLSLKTVNSRIMKGIIKTNEIDIIIPLMNLTTEEAVDIFFAHKVS